jgi:hypothetical protein
MGSSLTFSMHLSTVERVRHLKFKLTKVVATPAKSSCVLFTGEHHSFGVQCSNLAFERRSELKVIMQLDLNSAADNVPPDLALHVKKKTKPTKPTNSNETHSNTNAMFGDETRLQ